MKKSSGKHMRRLLCFCLIMTMILLPAFSVFAADEIPEDQEYEGGPVNETITQDAPPAEPVTSDKPVEQKLQDPVPEEEAAPATEETPEAAPQQNANENNDSESEESDVVSEETASPEQAAGDSTAVSGKASADTASSTETGTGSAVKSSSSASVHIGDTSFNSEDDESSSWSEGKGWKNIGGKYIAMVDYDGSEAEISADEGTVSLAVAGVNRIGKLTGNCSYQISGTGIVLIDSIEIEDGNTVTLHPNTAIYTEGSAAVFLKQADGSYMLVNDGITGILDEVYTLDDVNLVLPEGSSLTISAAAVRSEVWDDENGIGEDVTFYLTDLPYDANMPVHDTGHVEITGYIGNVVLGKNSTLTIDQGASIQMKKIKTGFESIEAELIVQGAMNVLGVLEGGFIDVKSGGSVTGNGTISSAEIDLDPAGTVSSDLLLDKSSLAINGDRTITPPMLKDSIIYLKGSAITIHELNVSGVSRIGVNTLDHHNPSYSSIYKIGNITVSPESRLEIVCNDHPSAALTEGYSRLVEDSRLEISGKITGGPVNVLGGSVWYTGKQTDIFPVVPVGYASRVFVDGTDTGCSLYPLNMTAEKAAELAKSETIPFSRLTVLDSLVSEDILAREWIVSSIADLEPIVRGKDMEFTCESFLKHVGMTGRSDPLTYYTAVEVINSDLTRELYFCDDRRVFNLDYAIMVRVLDCTGRGGQGGSAATHTNAAFTGNGVIGGPGSGSVQSGTGKVIFGKTSYVEPQPDPGPGPTPGPDPTPTPDPTPGPDPTPDPAPSPEPENGDSVDSDTGISDSGETTPDNNGNNSSTVIPDNNGNNSNTKKPDDNANNRKTVRTSDGKITVTSVSTGGLVVTVSTVEQNTEDQNAVNKKLPQIWHLDVTDSGVHVTDLSENPIKAVLPFTIPENWGDPAKIDNDSLYAVFADESGNLTAYSAEYDPEAGEVSFESKQTGDFVIAKFEYEDMPFTEDFYRKLADLEEIRLFLASIKE